MYSQFSVSSPSLITDCSIGVSHVSVLERWSLTCHVIGIHVWLNSLLESMSLIAVRNANTGQETMNNCFTAWA